MNSEFLIQIQIGNAAKHKLELSGVRESSKVTLFHVSPTKPLERGGVWQVTSIPSGLALLNLVAQNTRS